MKSNNKIVAGILIAIIASSFIILVVLIPTTRRDQEPFNYSSGSDITSSLLWSSVINSDDVNNVTISHIVENGILNITDKSGAGNSDIVYNLTRDYPSSFSIYMNLSISVGYDFFDIHLQDNNSVNKFTIRIRLNDGRIEFIQDQVYIVSSQGFPVDDVLALEQRTYNNLTIIVSSVDDSSSSIAWILINDQQSNSMNIADFILSAIRLTSSTVGNDIEVLIDQINVSPVINN